LFSKKEGQSTVGGDSTPYRNVVEFNNKIGKDVLYSTEFDSKLSNTTSPILISCFFPKTNVFNDPEIEYDSYYTGDFIAFLLEEVFRKDKRGGNLLIKTNTGTQQYLVEPKN